MQLEPQEIFPRGPSIRLRQSKLKIAARNFRPTKSGHEAIIPTCLSCACVGMHVRSQQMDLFILCHILADWKKIHRLFESLALINKNCAIQAQTKRNSREIQDINDCRIKVCLNY